MSDLRDPDLRDPYERPIEGRPVTDPTRAGTSYGGGGPGWGWGWIAGIVVVALIVAFFAFGTSGWRTAEVTSPPPPAVQRPIPPASGPNTTPPPVQPQPAPAPNRP